jgi:hypothetical protein
MIVHFFLILALVSAQDCKNPLFADPVALPDGTDYQMELLETPQPQADFGSCHDLDDKPSCCTSDTFVPILQAMKLHDADITSFLDFLSSAKPSEIAQELAAMWYADYDWQLNSKQINILTTMVSQTLELGEPFMQCYSGVLGYWQGMLCFACHPDWATYYNAVSNVMMLTTQTCNQLDTACMPLLDALQAYMLPMINNLIAFFEADNSPQDFQGVIEILTMYKTIFQHDTLCQVLDPTKTCQEIICQDFVHGLALGMNTTSLQSSAGGLKISPWTAHQLWHKFLKNSPLHTRCKRMMQHNTDMDSSPPVVALDVNNTLTENVYVNPPTPGYDASTIGCASSISQYACQNFITSSSSDSFPTWAIYVIVVIILVFVGALAVYILRRKGIICKGASPPGYTRMDEPQMEGSYRPPHHVQGLPAAAMGSVQSDGSGGV